MEVTNAVAYYATATKSFIVIAQLSVVEIRYICFKIIMLDGGGILVIVLGYSVCTLLLKCVIIFQIGKTSKCHLTQI